MSMLKFRRGLYSQINAAPVANGTVYIATDEKAMYVDTAEGRIRIGDFIRVDSVKDITPPYSTSSLYYVESDNALLKYDGSAWKQVNGTDDLKTELAGVKNRVSALEGTVGSAESGLVKDVADAKVAIKANADAIGVASTETTEATGLHALIEENAADIDAAADRIKALEDTVGTNEEGETLGGRVAALEGDMSQAKSDISTLQTESAKHAEKTYVDSTFAKTADIEGTLAKVDTDTGVKAAIEAAVAGEKSRAEAAEKALDDSLKAVKSTADNAVKNSAFETWKTENTAAIGTAKSEAVSAAKTYTNEQIAAEVKRSNETYATIEALESTDGIVSGHTASLATLNGTAETAGSVNWAKAAADAAMAKANEKTTMAEVEAKDYATKAEAQGYANAKDAAIKAAKDSADAAAGAAAAAQGDATAALEAIGDSTKGLTKGVADNKAAAAAAQKTIDDYKTAHAEDYTNAQVDSKIKAVSDVVANHTSSLATLTSADPSTAGSVAEAKKAGTDAQAAINEWKTAHAGDYTNTQIDAAIKVAKDAADAAQADANANAQSITALQGAVGTLNGDGEGSVKKAVADVKAELEASIAEEINAANAMTYVAGVQKAEDLPVNVPAGTTYVAEKTLGVVNGKQVFPGDLLIATGDEDSTLEDGTKVITVPTWTVVSTGYDASLEQTITTNDGKIQLTSAVGASNGQVAFVAAKDSAASVSVADNTVTIGMVWEDFPAVES